MWPTLNGWLFQDLPWPNDNQPEMYSIQRPLGCVPIVALQYIFSSIKRPPLFKDHFFLAHAWSLFMLLIICIGKKRLIFFASRYSATSTVLME